MRDLRIACGANFFAAPTQQTFSWDSLVNLLSSYDVAEETLEEYNKLPKTAQLKLKDRGWFNGNTYSVASRLTQHIESIALLALDVDNGSADIVTHIGNAIDPLIASDGFAHFIGSTRKHTPEKPRLRLVIPLTRNVSIDEADALKRMIAFRIGMKAFDTVSFRANQVMFWPSRCSDGEEFTLRADGDWLDPDAALAAWYPLGWQDRNDWPLHPSEEREALTHERRKAEDPCEKPGLVGEWCRLFTIEDVLERFLPDEYAPGSSEGRYTHVAGTTADGAIVYENKWMYSHHQTDPGSGQLLNAWDLVRIHKYGALDAKVRPGASIARVPSSRAMEEFARAQPEFKKALAEQAVRDFKRPDSEESEPSTIAARDLAGELTFNRAGQVEATHDNLAKIFDGHPTLKGALAYNHNSGAVVWRRFMPWHDPIRRSQQIDETDGLGFRDIDEIRIREWMVDRFRMEFPPIAKIKETVSLIADRNGFHPIREHLAGLKPWDGTPRLDTLFIRYLNCADTPYHRQAARVLLVGAVKRIMEPGCKFDTMILLIGDQRIKKSSFVECLAGRASWFSDDLPKLGKEAVEHIRSLWFCEVAELAQFTRTENEFIKAFLSRRMDRARLAYEQHSAFFPRQCVLVGTTNTTRPLKDPTGNGRYLPIRCEGFIPGVKMIDVDRLRTERDQLFAEAFHAYAAGEDIYIRDANAVAGAKEAQEDAREESPIEEAIDNWLDGATESKRSPMGIAAKWSPAAAERMRVSVAMIAAEALGFDPAGTDWPPWLSSRIVDHMHTRKDFERPKNPARIEGYGKCRVYERLKVTITADDL